MWEVLTGTHLGTLEGTGRVTSVSFSPDGRTLASGGENGTTLLWDLQVLFPRPQSLMKVSGDGQQGPAGAMLPELVVVSVLDQNGNPLAGATVNFTLTGGGTLSAPTVTTNAKGRAAAILTLGSEPGISTVTVSVAGLDPVTFTATGLTTADFDGDGQTGFSDFFLFADAFGGTDPRFDLDGSGSVDFADFFLLADHFANPEARGKLLALAREMIGLPEGPQLRQNVPNPFNSQTVISWFLLRPGPARLEVFSLTGQRGGGAAPGPAEGRRPPPPLGRPERPGPSPGQRRLPVSAGYQGKRSDAQADPAEVRREFPKGVRSRTESKSHVLGSTRSRRPPSISERHPSRHRGEDSPGAGFGLPERTAACRRPLNHFNSQTVIPWFCSSSKKKGNP